MRSYALALALGFAVSVMAVPEPAKISGISPMALRRRSIPELAHSVLDILTASASRFSSRITTIVPLPSAPVEDEEADADDSESDAEYYATYGSYEADVLAWEDRHAECAEVCRVRTIEGAKSGQEALCSADGLLSTLACAQCIDTNWPEDMYENTAMSEYTRIATMCEAPEGQL